MEEMGERLRQARQAAGFKSARSAAIKFGWTVSTYAAHENGQNKYDDGFARDYGKAFKASPGWLMTGDGLPASTIRPASSLNTAPVAGTIQAGNFREAEDFNDFQHAEISVPPDPDFPFARQIVFIAQGDSMDAAQPQPITPGTYVVCVDFDDLEIPMRDGMQVVVQRSRDDGALREWSVKEVRMHDDEIECIPRSKNKRHKAFRFPLNANPDDGQEIKILALVRYVFGRVPLPK